MLTPDEKVIESFAESIKEAKTKEHLNLLADQVSYDASMGALPELHAAGLLKRISDKIQNIEEQQ